MRWWKILGLAAFASVAATGVVIARDQRRRRAYTPEEIRAQLPVGTVSAVDHAVAAGGSVTVTAQDQGVAAGVIHGDVHAGPTRPGPGSS